MTLLIKVTIGIVLLSFSLFGIRHSSATPPVDMVSLGLNKSARIGADLTVRVDSLIDSRCPVDVSCFWAGQAVVALSLSNDIDTRKCRLLIPGLVTPQSDSTTIQFGNTQYSIILKDVVPYPARAVDQLDRQAIIQVTKL